ncbi:MAG: hypothetical protein KAX04_01685 [Methanomicrobia archaeon]|nr:hypothetical protein [Methanomicrobia archaeon]
MDDPDKKESEREHNKEWGIYILIILGAIFMISAIVYVIHSEKPVETYPPTTTPPATPPVTTPPPPPTTTPPTTVPPTTAPPTTVPPTPPETKQKIKWEKNLIEAEIEEYTTDNRIGVKVMRIEKKEEYKSTAVEVLFENKTEVPQPFNLKNISLFFYKREGEYIKDNVQWTQLIVISFEAEDFNSIKEIPPKSGLRVIFHFHVLRWQPDYITFQNYYYDDLEYSEWRIKVRY